MGEKDKTFAGDRRTHTLSPAKGSLFEKAPGIVPY